MPANFWIRYAVALAIVSAMMVVLCVLGRRLKRNGNAHRRRKRLRVVDSIALSPRASVAVVEAAERRFLIGAGDAGVTLVAELQPRVDAPPMAKPAAGKTALLGNSAAMKFFALLPAAIAAAAMVSGCSSSAGSSSNGAPSSNSPARAYLSPQYQHAAGGGLIYIADYTNSAVHIYPLRGKNQQEIGLITGDPVIEYLNVDRWHNLYVVEFVAGKVLVYPRGATQPSLTLTVQPSGAFPNAVAISHGGEVAVGQFQTNGINFFHRGATAPFKIVKPPASFGSAGFCAYDANGNLYVIGSAASRASHIGEIIGGGKGNKIVDLGVNTGITNAKGIQVDKQGNVVVVGDSGTLNTYAPQSNTLLNSVQLLDPPGGPNPNGGFSFLSKGHALYVASAILNRQNLGQAFKYAYPAGGNILNTITVQNPPSGQGQTAVTGVAVDPPEQP